MEPRSRGVLDTPRSMTVFTRHIAQSHISRALLNANDDTRLVFSRGITAADEPRLGAYRKFTWSGSAARRQLLPMSDGLRPACN